MLELVHRVRDVDALASAVLGDRCGERGLADRVRAALRASRARAEWDAARFLEGAGVPTPEPLVLAERRRGLALEQAASAARFLPARETFERLFDVEPRLEVVHGGLECAVIGDKLPGVEMISLGPEVVGPHAPGERLSIPATQRFYRLLGALLDDLSR